MYAMRLARAVTGRDKIVKFEGGYHGMSAEAQMSLAPDRLVNFPVAVPDSAGIPESLRDEMLIAPFNDIDFVHSLIAKHAGDIAGIIVEPLQRIIPPTPGFLEGLRAACSEHGIVLIFDEVVTGIRLAYGGAQERYGVTPDVCTLGKVVGGGFALGAVAGKADIMAHFDKDKVGQERFLMHVRTLSGPDRGGRRVEDAGNPAPPRPIRQTLCHRRSLDEGDGDAAWRGRARPSSGWRCDAVRRGVYRPTGEELP